ncbi:MAG TPA: type III secretion system chaperone [Acidimicrobiales bacterium]|nr:type III secretion system chaperone [Acidimicrobiales bacterium]
MTRAPLGDADSASQLDETVTAWAAQWHASALLGVEHQPIADDRGHFHWLIRLKGEEKSVITLWLSLRQRTVHVETEVISAAEENRETLYHFLLTKNAELRELHLAIGPEEGIYLMAKIPINEVTTERLDEVVGATLTYVEEIYPTAMTMGLSSLYRRRRST